MRFLACSSGERAAGALDDLRSGADKLGVAEKITQMRLRAHTKAGNIAGRCVHERQESSEQKNRAMGHILRWRVDVADITS